MQPDRGTQLEERGEQEQDTRNEHSARKAPEGGLFAPRGGSGLDGIIRRRASSRTRLRRRSRPPASPPSRISIRGPLPPPRNLFSWKPRKPCAHRPPAPVRWSL